MSFSFKFIGSAAAVAAAVSAHQTIPAGIKSTILEILNEPDTANTGNDAVLAEGHGHVGGGYGSIGALKVEKFKLLALPPVEEAKPVEVAAVAAPVVEATPAPAEAAADPAPAASS